MSSVRKIMLTPIPYRIRIKTIPRTYNQKAQTEVYLRVPHLTRLGRWLVRAVQPSTQGTPWVKNTPAASSGLS
jgi:hypothetical protein